MRKQMLDPSNLFSQVSFLEFFELTLLKSDTLLNDFHFFLGNLAVEQALLPDRFNFISVPFE